VLSKQLFCISLLDNKFILYENQPEICRTGIHQQEASAAIALLQYIFVSFVEELEASIC
jgi:hypothetical protein